MSDTNMEAFAHINWANDVMGSVARQFVYAKQGLLMIRLAREPYFESRTRALLERKPELPIQHGEWWASITYASATHAMRVAAMNFIHQAITDVVIAGIYRCAEYRLPATRAKYEGQKISLEQALDGNIDPHIARLASGWVASMTGTHLTARLATLYGIIGLTENPGMSISEVEQLVLLRNDGVHEEGKELNDWWDDAKAEGLFDRVMAFCTKLVEKTLAALPSPGAVAPLSLEVADEERRVKLKKPKDAVGATARPRPA